MNLLLKICLACSLLFWNKTKTIAQTIENTTGVEQVQKLNFNPSVLKKNRVRSIQSTYMIKKELSPIIKKPHISTYYEFDNKGRQTMYYKTFLLIDTIYDTLVEYYSYNKKNQLISKRRSEYGKFGVYEFTYKNEKLYKTEHFTEQNSSKSKITFIPKNRTHQETEIYQTEKLDSLSYVRYTLSSDSVRYKEEEAIYEENKLKRKYTRLLFGPQKYDIINYAYFENDLVKKEVVDNFNSEVKKQYIYTYTENKNLKTIKIYQGKKETHLYTIEFLYQEDSNLPNAILKKQEATGTIEITKLKYTFY